jgi:hypothetical protein
MTTIIDERVRNPTGDLARVRFGRTLAEADRRGQEERRLS